MLPSSLPLKDSDYNAQSRHRHLCLITRQSSQLAHVFCWLFRVIYQVTDGCGDALGIIKRDLSCNLYLVQSRNGVPAEGTGCLRVVVTPVGDAVGAEGMTALKAHIVGGFSMVVLADSAEVGQRGHDARFWATQETTSIYRKTKL